MKSLRGMVGRPERRTSFITQPSKRAVGALRSVRLSSQPSKRAVGRLEAYVFHHSRRNGRLGGRSVRLSSQPSKRAVGRCENVRLSSPATGGNGRTALLIGGCFAASKPDGDGTSWESEKITFRPCTCSAATKLSLREQVKGSGMGDQQDPHLPPTAGLDGFEYRLAEASPSLSCPR